MSDVLTRTRRADWRFLLPDPGLGRVACLAPQEPELIDALLALDARVDWLDAPGDASDHDVVVLSGGSRRRVAAARALLRPGGWLYAEVTGPAAAGWARTLRAAGFDEVSAHWLWPDARRCREMVPLQRAALLHALGRRDPGARLRLRVAAARMLVRLGLFPLAVRRAAVIGRRA
ncbi:MAG: hypothetical protein ACXVFN_17055 [Solirubrobacteraceae bacterium]